MFTKLLVLVLLAVTVSSNPGAEEEWHWVPRTLTVSRNGKLHPIPKDIVKPKDQKPRPKPEKVVVDNCGTTPVIARTHHDVKIVGGNEAIPHSYPWQAALFLGDNFFCSGSLISSEWLLTAGHCLRGLENESVTIVLGAHNITYAEASQVTLYSTVFITHEDYNFTTAHNDIGLIQLPKPVEFNDYIQPVCLPTGESDLDGGVSVIPTGWGKIYPRYGNMSDVLNEVTVPTETDADCASYYGTEFINGDQICIDGAGGRGTCNGDSGGPLNYKTVGGWEIRGITSFGSWEGCKAGAPDAFTQVTHYLDWIETNTGVTSSKFKKRSKYHKT